MTPCKILSLVSILWTLSCCTQKFAAVDTIDPLIKNYYETLFLSLPKPYKLDDNQEEHIIYKFYSPWCHSCLEELSHLQDFVSKKGNQYKVYLFSIEESDETTERFGFKVHYVPGLFDRTKYQQVPLTFIFKNKILSSMATNPMNYSKLQ
ncbi:MAG: TlpA family protein disulfide reductase [Oligoflexales bacterium]